MKKVFKIIGWVLLILLVVLAIVWFGFLKPEPPPISSEDRAEITLMPLPSQLKMGKGTFVLDDQMGHTFTNLSTPRMDRAMARFYKKLTLQTGLAFGSESGKKLILECTGGEMTYPSLGDVESYSIKITGAKIIVKAASETGILYALESLLQLLKEEESSWVLPQLSIEDQPRYPWRGLMIDVCRHWIPKEVILRNLEGMATAKMNVFHWHLTDHQGFRVESKIYPKLHKMGSNGDYYSQEEIKEVIEYAADRGIRVVPEFDVPGHTESWFLGHPELASAPGPYHLDTGMMGLQPAMDPTREEVYSFLDAFFGEMSELFPDAYFHIGGDEVEPTHWNENSDIRLFMKENELEDSHALQAHFNIRLQKIVAAHGKIMMGWDEILHPDLPREGIAVQTWRDHGSLWESARLGNQAVLSTGYYLDHKRSAAYLYNVDPTVIPGAVDIEIDSSHWKGWDCTLKIADMTMDGALYLFGEGAELRGIMDMMGGASGFSQATLQGDLLSFTLETPMGDMEYNTKLDGDSISGAAKFSIFKLELKGGRSGGSDMEGGTPLPEFKKIEALSPDQETRLIGGEACIWSEMVNEATLESRTWPRAAVVGEKMWSPKALTDDVDDMYRRLLVMDTRLESLGMRHRSYSYTISKPMVDEVYHPHLRTLIDVLQEDILFNRLAIYKPAYFLTTPLNRVVDAALSESLIAYQLGKSVNSWLEFENEKDWDLLIAHFELWAGNHQRLAPAFEGNWKLQEVEAHSIHLSALAKLGLDVLTDPGSLKGHHTEIEALLTSAKEAHGGTLLAVVEAVQKLVESATKK